MLIASLQLSDLAVGKGTLSPPQDLFDSRLSAISLGAGTGSPSLQRDHSIENIIPSDSGVTTHEFASNLFITVRDPMWLEL
jgi:hypothetical protein